MSPDQLTALLNTALRAHLAGKIPGKEIVQLERLSGGADNETWRVAWGGSPPILWR